MVTLRNVGIDTFDSGVIKFSRFSLEWKVRYHYHRTGILGLAFLTISFLSLSYRTVADRLLNLRLVPARRLVQRDVSYEFMNRQMVWHAFTVCSGTDAFDQR